VTDPYWTTAASSLIDASQCRSPLIGMIGAPLFRASITPGRCDLAPGSIRAVMCRIASYDTDMYTDLASYPIADFGDLDVASLLPEAAYDPIVTAVARIAARCSHAVAIIGGDNSVTRPGFQGVARRYGRCGLITLDAHHDVRATDKGLHNGNPIRALIEDGVPGSDIVQIGIQSFCNSAVYTNYARKAGIRFFTVAETRRRGAAHLMATAIEDLGKNCDAIYLDLDIDVADRAFAPSAPGSRSGGLLPAELFEAVRIAGAAAKVRAIDIVEHDPGQDLRDLTAFLAASCLVRFLSAAVTR
jgi:formiminoglutamase